MTWTFDTCTDIYGDCIRQYVIFGLSVIVLLLALYSCLRTYCLQNKFTIELLPLLINTITSLIQAALYSQMQIYNTRIILLVVEIYSYFLISYGFILMVMSSQSQFQPKIKLMNIVFIAVSLLNLVAIVTLIVLSVTNVIECKQDQGTGSIVLISVEMLLLLVTFIYSCRYKQIISPQSRDNPLSEFASQHLLNVEDQYVRLKVLQLNLVRFAFIVTFVLHLGEILSYQIVDQQIICVNGQIQVTSGLQLYILIVENVSQLFPHFIIPFIFWYLPAKITKSLKRPTDLSFEEKDVAPSLPYHSKHRPKIAIQRKNSSLVSDMRSEEILQQKRQKGIQRRFSKMGKMLLADQQ